MKVLELRGFKSLWALKCVSHPDARTSRCSSAYMGESYEDFYARVEEMPAIDQEKLIREAALFVELQKEEVEALICFCTDVNGVPYTAENPQESGPKELHEIIVAVCIEISKIKIDLVGEKQKKTENVQRQRYGDLREAPIRCRLRS